MKYIMTICLLVSLSTHRSAGQSPVSQAFMFAGYPAVGVDYARRISHARWSSRVWSLSASPTYYFYGYNFHFARSTSRFSDQRIILPVMLRYEFYLNQILLPKMGKRKTRIGFFVDVGYAAAYSIRAHLRETFFSKQDPSSPAFSFDGDIAAGSSVSFHPVFGFGMKFGHVLFDMRSLLKPYPWKDLSTAWTLPDEARSYFYGWENTQPGVMLCLGYIF